jgi:hypothetical protein
MFTFSGCLKIKPLDISALFNRSPGFRWPSGWAESGSVSKLNNINNYIANVENNVTFLLKHAPFLYFNKC